MAHDTPSRRSAGPVLACGLFVLALAAGAAAGEVRELELNDGSIVSGEIVSLNNGVYTVRSGSLGTIRIDESAVRTIRRKAAAPAPATGADALQERMLTNKEVMELIESLQDDQEFKAILEDPDIMKAINAGDVAALMADPRFMKLLNHSTVREIRKKVK